MKNKLIISTVCACLLACSPKKSEQEYIASAEQLMSKESYKEAIIELKNAVKINKEVAHSRFLLAQSYLRTGNIAGAQKEFNRSLELGGDANHILPELIRVNLYIGDTNRAIELIDSQSGLEPDTLTTINSLVGIGVSQISNFDQGMQLLAKTLAFEQTENFYHKLAKAWVAANEQQLQLAIELTESLAENDTEFDDATLLLTNLYVLDANYEQALSGFERYIDKHPHNLVVQINHINVLIQANNLELAEQHINSLLKGFPSSAIVNELKAEVQLRNGNYKEATEYASIALTNQPDLFKANMIAGIAFYKIDSVEMAYHHLAPIENSLPNNHFAKQILTQVKLQLGYTEDAIAVIDSLGDISEADFQLLASASVALLKSGDSKKAKEYIQKMDDIDTNDAQMLSKRGVFKLSVNDTSGVEDLNQAIATDPEFQQPRLALLYNFIQNKQYQDAMTVANSWVNDFPDKDGGYLAQGIVWQSQLNRQLAIQAFEKALTVNPESIGALLNIASYEYSERRYNRSFELVKKLLDINPNHSAGIELLVNLSGRIEDQNAALEFIEQKIENIEENLIYRIARAKTLENTGNREQALADLKVVKQQANNDAIYLTTYAQMAFRAKQYVLSEQLFRQLQSVKPTSFVAQNGILFALEAQKKHQQAFTEVKKAQERFPSKKNLLLYEVNYLTLSKSYNSAKQVLDKVDAAQVDQQLFLSVNSQYYMAIKDNQSALRFVEASYKQKPTVQSLYRYTQVLQNLGRNNDALAVVESGIEKFGERPVLSNIMAELNTKVEPQKSLTYYQKLVDEKPGNFVALNNLAWSAIMVGEYDRALIAAKEAIELAPERPQIQDTLAVAHMRKGNYQEAFKLLSIVVTKLPNEEEVLLHYAESLIHIDKLVDAKTVLDGIPDSANKKRVSDLLNE
ncbi:XrtA/PEP-CTERM system TPR-repeat protein PrsT [Thalassotalea crassostreae]|uniref:XrtA/PEP-CTERM system TPR-repeat protein PrsT n=1 Tax=Thalassotalea crassostreae TaxID=1763536 RepID=UPI000837AA12|nr:XrtA/PEP-CTERM system TPR-repeat protein PrsT [Thalassotalea crassostreae]